MLKQTRDIDKYTQDYLNYDFEDTMIYYRRKKVLEILNKYNPKKILEIGCGTQSIFDFYTDYETFTVVEPSDQFCKLIKQSDKYNSRITIINDFLENQTETLRNKEFDFILLSSLLHEVAEPLDLLNVINKLCNKETIVHINVPNSNSFHLIWAYTSGLIDSLGNLTETAKTLQQNTAFNIEKLMKIIREAHFEILDKGSYFIKPFNHSKMQECMALGIIDEQLLNGLYKLTHHIPDMGAEIFINCRLK